MIAQLKNFILFLSHYSVLIQYFRTFFKLSPSLGEFTATALVKEFCLRPIVKRHSLTVESVTDLVDMYTSVSQLMLHKIAETLRSHRRQKFLSARREIADV